MSLSGFSTFWLYLTVAGRGRRDARRGVPGEQGWRYIGGADKPKQDSQREASRLSFVEALMVTIADYDAAKEITAWERNRQGLKVRAQQIQYHLAKALQEYVMHLEAHRRRRFQQPLEWRAKIPFILLLVLGAYGEFVFNLSAFRILRIPEEEVQILACALATTLTTLGHLVGMVLRQWQSWITEGYKYSIATLAIVTSGVLCLALGGVGILRHNYLAYSLKSEPDLGEILAMMVINLAFVILAGIAGFLTAAPDHTLAQVLGDRRRSHRTLERIWKAWVSVAGQYDTERAYTMKKIEEIQCDALIKIDEYRAWVHRSGPERNCPPHFHEATGRGLFSPQDLGPALNALPASLDELLQKFENEAHGDLAIHTIKEVPNETLHLASSCLVGGNGAGRQ